VKANSARLFCTQCALILCWAAASAQVGFAQTPPAGGGGLSAEAPLPMAPVQGEVPQTNFVLPGFQSSDGYTYDPTGRKDPFRPFRPAIVAAPTPAEKPAPPSPLNNSQSKVEVPAQPVELDPLQSYDVTQYKVVGIMWDTHNPKAVIKDPQGKSFVIRKQTKIGRSSGFVVAIREGEVVVVEAAQENGVTTAATRILPLVR